MIYNTFSLNQRAIKKERNRFPEIKKFQYQEGVFLHPNGNFIVRVKIRSTYTTISQHIIKLDAETAYSKFKNLL